MNSYSFLIAPTTAVVKGDTVDLEVDMFESLLIVVWKVIAGC